MATTPPPQLRTAPRPAPLTPLLVFVFVSSLGTGAITHGVYFLTESALAYKSAQNYALAAMFGGIYIVSAAAAGPSLRRLARRAPWLSTRGLLVLSVLLIAAACALPILTQRPGAGARAWSLWVLLAVYAGATGVLWPITESYISGGRVGRAMRSATGRFNIAWSSATVAALLLMGPMVRSAPLEFLAIVGALHLATLPLLWLLPPSPPPHPEDDHPDAPPRPEVYTRLLSAVRVMLPLSYLYASALIPQLPTALERLNVNASWKPGVASVYLLARLVGFALFERWHAWHGRRSMLWIGAAILIVGFSLGVVSPELASRGLIDSHLGLALLTIGLALFGIGASMIYAAAIYYAMAVGSASVDAGGTHEALIGCGYLLGPLCGLAALASASHAGIAPENATTIIVIFVSISIGIACWRVSARRGKLWASSDV